MAEPYVSLSHIGAFVPFPSALLDEQMPHLKDTEWRLLCVIVRQTLGWQSGGGRKRRDWMSQKQLMARTGRNSAALSAALDALVRKNLVECCDAQGEPLLTREQRRRHRGRVYFALAPHLLLQDEVASPAPTAKGSLSRIATGWEKASDVVSRVDYRLQSEVQKAKWTKENGNKRNSLYGRRATD